MKKQSPIQWIVMLVFTILCSTTKTQANADCFLTTYTNPTPADSEWFAWAVAGVGTDKVLIGALLDNMGAPGSGAAYLYSTDGTLLTTYTNPTPAINDGFGGALSGVGTDKVLIGTTGDDTGAQNAGAAYLYGTDGTLLTTYTNPTPAISDGFGGALSGVGTDKVLIGTTGDDTGAQNAGAAYLYSTDGTLLTTYTNPTPAISDGFGGALSGVGTDKVLIGASGDDTGAPDAGAAYLYGTDGTLLTTYTNPTPAISDRFGQAVAEVGTDKVLIGASGDDTGAPDAGAAYLYGTDGTLLTTYTNPTPAGADSFGRSVSAVGAYRVLIGADFDGAGARRAGAAYLYSTDGTLLTTYTNPMPAVDDYFGFALSGVGTDQVLIGAYSDDTGASDAGAAYLYQVLPLLSITSAGSGQATISWTLGALGFVLQETPSLSPTNWVNSPSGTNNPVVVPVSGTDQVLSVEQAVGVAASPRLVGVGAGEAEVGERASGCSRLRSGYALPASRTTGRTMNIKPMVELSL